jgi:hypothetical protein
MKKKSPNYDRTFLAVNNRNCPVCNEGLYYPAGDPTIIKCSNSRICGGIWKMESTETFLELYQKTLEDLGKK